MKSLHTRGHDSQKPCHKYSSHTNLSSSRKLQSCDNGQRYIEQVKVAEDIERGLNISQCPCVDSAVVAGERFKRFVSWAGITKVHNKGETRCIEDCIEAHAEI